MLKNIISKINNIIQWTKKWHFFHMFMIPTTYIYIYFFLKTRQINLLNIPFFIRNIFYYLNHITDLLNIIHELIDFYILELIFGGMAEILYIPVIIVIQLIFWIVNWYKHKNIQTQSKFLLNNKIYNSIYTIAFIHTAIHFALGFVILVSACVELCTNYINKSF